MLRKSILLALTLILLGVTSAACRSGETPAVTTEKADETAAATEAVTDGTPETDPDVSPEITGTPVKVIVLSGQSNAVGYTYDNFKRSDFKGERLDKANAGYQNVLIRFCNNPYIEDERIENDAFEPTTFGCGCLSHYEGFRSFGPEIGIAETLSDAYPDETFYIVKCATSGANLFDQFNPNNRAKSENLYIQMVGYVNDALQSLVSEGYKPEIIAFCWIQGGGDWPGDASAYLNTYRQLIQALKEEWAAWLPANGMSTIDAGIDAISNANPEPLNAVKEAFASETSKRYFFPVTDLKLGSNMHFDAGSMIAIGNRFGERLLTVIQTLDEPEQAT